MRRRTSPLRRAAIATGAALALAIGGIAVLWVSLPDPASFARTAPRTTALIEQRRAEARAKKRALHVQRTWVPLERIPQHVRDAVILSEDARFFGHEGIDWEATRAAAEHDLARGRLARGGSTITQQLAKNLWLGTERSLWRKAKEAVLAWKLERALAKPRILALYFNVVELGDGVFGFEAGARARFGVGVSDLSLAQAVVLASMLPAPRKVNLDQPSTWFQRRSRRLLDRMVQAGRVTADEHRRASAELERILAGPRPEADADEPPEEEPPGPMVEAPAEDQG
jgi:monofunctional biosynthetic peptidoglycan transglycosylase